MTDSLTAVCPLWTVDGSTDRGAYAACGPGCEVTERAHERGNQRDRHVLPFDEVTQLALEPGAVGVVGGLPVDQIGPFPACRFELRKRPDQDAHTTSGADRIAGKHLLHG